MADIIDETRSWNVLYPAYINGNRTVAKGRRIPLQFAVADPKENEVVDALHALKGFKVALQKGKPYCREMDKEAVHWRVRYNNVDPSRNNLANKRQILVACAKRISEVRSKSGPSNAHQAPASGGAGESSGTSKKKKNKNK